MPATVSIVLQPDLYSPVNKELWYKVSSTASVSTDFKYVFRVLKKNEPFETNSFVPLSLYKVPPSPDGGYGLFSPHKLLKSFFKYNINPFQSGLLSNFTPNPYMGIPDAYIEYTINYGYQYNPNQTYYDVFFYNSTNCGLTFSTPHGLQVNDSIIVDKVNKTVNISYDGVANIIAVPNPYFAVIDKPFGQSTPNGTDGGKITYIYRISGTASSRYAFNGTRQYRERTRDFSEYILGLTNSVNGSYQFNSPTGLVNRKFLRDYPLEYKPIFFDATENKTRNEYETASFIMKEPVGTTASIRINIHSSSGAIQQTYSYSVPIKDNEYRRLDVGVGTQNIANSFNTNWSNPNYSYYTVTYLQNGVTASETLKYKLVSECSPYPRNQWVRVFWLNRQGGFDYFTFTRDVKKSVSIKRDDYNRILPYDYSVGERGKTTFATKAEETYTIQSNWINDKEAEWLEELMTSPEVYIIGNDNQVDYSALATAYKLPIVLTDSKYEVKTTLRDKMFNFILNYKLAYNINLQND